MWHIRVDVITTQRGIVPRRDGRHVTRTHDILAELFYAVVLVEMEVGVVVGGSVVFGVEGFADVIL